jgi:TRAP-type C4-dicarboxylate transport system permease small subunit
VSRFLFAWLAFVGTALAYQRKAHVAIDFLVDRAPSALRASVSVFVHMVVMSFAIIMLVYGVRLCLSTRMVSTVLLIPMWAPYAAIPVSGALMFMHGLVAILRIITPGPVWKEAQA